MVAEKTAVLANGHEANGNVHKEQQEILLVNGDHHHKENGVHFRSADGSDQIQVLIVSKGDDLNDTEDTKIRTSARTWIMLVIMALTDFITFASITILAPFFPQMAEEKGASPAAYGTIIGIFELVALIVSNICIKAVSVLSPRILIVAGIILLGITTIIFGVMDHLPRGVAFISVGILLRSLQGAGAGIIDVCTYMVATTEMPTRVSTAIIFRGQAILQEFCYYGLLFSCRIPRKNGREKAGVLEMAVGLGLTAGPAAGGALFDVGGYAVPFLVLGCITLTLAPGNYVLCPSTKGNSDRKLKNILQFLKDLEVIICITSIASGGAVLGFLTGVLEPHLRQFHLSTTDVGVITITTGGVFALTTPIWGHLCDKNVNPYYLMFSGCVLCFVGFFSLGPFPFIPVKSQLWLVVVSLVLCGLGAAAQSVCPYVLMLRGAKRDGLPDDVTTSALVSAVHITSSNAGCFIGPFIGGLFIQFVGFRNGTAIVVAFETILIILMLLSWRRYR